MTKRLVLFLGVLAATVAVATPKIGFYRQQSETVTASYVGGSGTNTVIDIPNTNGVPFQLVDVLATVDSTATSVTVYRVWNYQRDVFASEVSTNMFSQTETNTYLRTQVAAQTNKVYDSSTDAYPTNAYFLPDDGIIADFGETTNVVLRLIGH